MNENFSELKNKSAGELTRLAGLMRFDLGTHARTKLRLAGCANSGTLLHKIEAKKHGEHMASIFKKHWKKTGKRGTQIERLRMVTVLDSVAGLDVAEILCNVSAMEKRIQKWLHGMRVCLVAAVEVEVFSIEFLEKVNAQGTVEKRKLAVLKTMTAAKGSAALIHFHGVIDAMDVDVGEVVERAKEIWTGAYAVDFQQTYKKRSVATNISKIFNYATKGGNDFLRYKTGFGRETDEDLDGKMWRKGTGRADMGGETVADERGLSLGEIKILDAVYAAIQVRKRGMRGHEIIKSV